MGNDVRSGYVDQGVDGYYAAHRADYRNPHEPGIEAAIHAMRPPDPAGRVLDLCCGSGEATLALREMGLPPENIDACDPFTAPAYLARTGRPAFPWSFVDLANGALEDRRYTLIVCSFALHLCERSRLPLVVRRLAGAAPELWVLTPHKRPELRPEWGFRLREERYDPHTRVRLRAYELS